MQRKVGSVLIVEDNELLGIFTERDVIRCVAEGIPMSEKLKRVMTKDVITIN